MKTITIIFFTSISFLFATNLKAQAMPKDTATYEYAILGLNGSLSGNNLNVIFENKQNVSVLDLDEKLNLDTIQGGTRTTRFYKY